jgi:hypothetical protein
LVAAHHIGALCSCFSLGHPIEGSGDRDAKKGEEFEEFGQRARGGGLRAFKKKKKKKKKKRRGL